MILNLTCEELLQKLASDDPTPGGGSVSALAGALAGGLVQMVGRLTKDEESGRIAEVTAEADALTKRLTHLMERDTEAFQSVMAAYRMPKTTAEEKQERSRQIRLALRGACEVPLQVMEVSLQVLHLALEAAETGNKNAVSDAGVAGLLGWAAVRGAAYNVRINLPGVKDQAYAGQVRRRMGEIATTADRLRSTIENCMPQ